MEKEELRKTAKRLTEEKALVDEWLKNGLVNRNMINTIAMVAGNEKKISRVRDFEGTTIEWVGIGWVLIDSDMSAPVLY